MDSFGGQISQGLESTGLELDKLRRAQRIAKVSALWKELVEQHVLDHTNAVYIFEKDGAKEMHVYVDDSLYAAELNSRRELISMQCRSKYGELIDKFEIHISYGERKKTYPFRERSDQADKGSIQELSAEQMQRVEQACAAIDDPKLKRAFRQAMIADLQWIRPESQ